MLAENNGRLPLSKPNPIDPQPGYPAAWHTATVSSHDAFHNLLAFYHKQGRWRDALQLMGQHRHHLVRQKPSLILYALEVLTTAAEEGKGDPAWIRLLAKHIQGKELDAEMSARLQVLFQKLGKLTEASRQPNGHRDRPQSPASRDDLDPYRYLRFRRTELRILSS